MKIEPYNKVIHKKLFSCKYKNKTKFYKEVRNNQWKWIRRGWQTRFLLFHGILLLSSYYLYAMQIITW